MKLLIEAPVNGGRNYNGPKVKHFVALVKSGHMLENPMYLTVLSKVIICKCGQSAGKIWFFISIKNQKSSETIRQKSVFFQIKI